MIRHLKRDVLRLKNSNLMNLDKWQTPFNIIEIYAIKDDNGILEVTSLKSNMIGKVY